jgi:hypothetical protein
MDLCVLQSRRQTVCPDKMSFWNEKPGARARFPLRRVLELFGGATEFNRDSRLRGSFLRRRLLRD